MLIFPIYESSSLKNAKDYILNKLDISEPINRLQYEIVRTIIEHPIRIPNSSRKNLLDISFLILYLSFNKYGFTSVNRFILNHKSGVTADNIKELVSLFKATLPPVIKSVDFFDKDGDAGKIVSDIIINDKFLNLLDLGHPANFSPKSFEKYTINTNRKNYTVPEYFHDFFNDYLPLYSIYLEYYAQFPSNLKNDSNKKNIDRMISLLSNYKILKPSVKKDIFNTYFIAGGDNSRGIIKRFFGMNNFLDNFEIRINSYMTMTSPDVIKSICSSYGAGHGKVVYDESDVLIIRVFSYALSKVIGAASSWCTTTGQSYFDLENKNGMGLYYLFNFNLEPTDSLFMIGFTLGADGALVRAHDKLDEPFSNVLVSYLENFNIDLGHIKRDNTVIFSKLIPWSKEDIEATYAVKDIKERLVSYINDITTTVGTRNLQRSTVEAFIEHIKQYNELKYIAGVEIELNKALSIGVVLSRFEALPIWFSMIKHIIEPKLSYGETFERFIGTRYEKILFDTIKEIVPLIYLKTEFSYLVKAFFTSRIDDDIDIISIYEELFEKLEEINLVLTKNEYNSLILNSLTFPRFRSPKFEIISELLQKTEFKINFDSDIMDKKKLFDNISKLEGGVFMDVIVDIASKDKNGIDLLIKTSNLLLISRYILRFNDIDFLLRALEVYLNMSASYPYSILFNDEFIELYTSLNIPIENRVSIADKYKFEHSALFRLIKLDADKNPIRKDFYKMIETVRLEDLEYIKNDLVELGMVGIYISLMRDRFPEILITDVYKSLLSESGDDINITVSDSFSIDEVIKYIGTGVIPLLNLNKKKYNRGWMSYILSSEHDQDDIVRVLEEVDFNEHMEGIIEHISYGYMNTLKSKIVEVLYKNQIIDNTWLVESLKYNNNMDVINFLIKNDIKIGGKESDGIFQSLLKLENPQMSKPLINDIVKNHLSDSHIITRNSTYGDKSISIIILRNIYDNNSFYRNLFDAFKEYSEEFREINDNDNPTIINLMRRMGFTTNIGDNDNFGAFLSVKDLDTYLNWLSINGVFDYFTDEDFKIVKNNNYSIPKTDRYIRGNSKILFDFVMSNDLVDVISINDIFITSTYDLNDFKYIFNIISNDEEIMERFREGLFRLRIANATEILDYLYEIEWLTDKNVVDRYEQYKKNRSSIYNDDSLEWVRNKIKLIRKKKV